MTMFNGRGFSRGHGVFNKTFTVAGAKPSSSVVASISETANVGGVAQPHFGDANMSIANVRGIEGGIEVRVNIDWGDDLDYQIAMHVEI